MWFQGTWNVLEKFLVVTDLLMARTRLRLRESLACMVYLHRWNYYKQCFLFRPDSGKKKEILEYLQKRIKNRQLQQ